MSTYLKIISIGLLTVASMADGQVYPSTETAWVLTGNWQQPTAISELNTIKEVRRWEADHADVVFGSLQDVELNQKTIAMGYIYVHKLDCRPDEQQGWLHRHAYLNGHDPEKGYMHYKNDTQLTVPVQSQGLNYLLNGEPMLSLFIRNNNFSTARFPLTVNDKEQIIFHAAYPFENIVIDSNKHPELWVTRVNDDGDIGGFEKADVHWIQREGKWFGHINQRWLPTNAKFQGRELNTGNKALKAGYRSWVVALNWKSKAEVKGVNIEPWLSIVKTSDKQAAATMLFPGWDPKNDPNNDGYVDDDEFLARANQAASARFKHQARVIPTGKMWAGSCWYRTNFNDDSFNQNHANWYKYDWKRQGLTGAYNDDMAKLFSTNQFNVQFGGQILEAPIRAGTSKAAGYYAAKMSDFLDLVKSTTGSQWLSANISELNLWEYPDWPKQLRGVVDVWLREHYLSPAIGLERLQSYWDSYALAALGDKSLIMTTTRGGKSQQTPLSKQAWEDDIYTGLALYYLFNIPNKTYYHSWNQTFIYGSNNTHADPKQLNKTIWYRTGEPKNWAYQPHKLLSVDIGKPTTMPNGFEVVKWLSKTGKVATDDTKLEDISLEPANWFWLYRTGWFDDVPKDGVIARQYTQGLVLYRGSKYRNHAEFYQVDSIRVPLSGLYQKVNYDGSLGEPTQYVEVNGYEGVILKKVEKGLR
ncbi:hypothetical protein L4D04_08185 [Photobacterium angustum]|uniref:Uncharacterized protein n=1 Tax=Photobacterium angustum (strain S14 / CCUG 15956) TaxID=314292 RepID=Q1ZPQ9_PHOAS|nr:hypothetical protein [Photobacterium angustum]EAS63901.1 hypothetical protein VAS14_16646 [Photobacterium angustum S14]